jgi:hypothetical protein
MRRNDPETELLAAASEFRGIINERDLDAFIIDQDEMEEVELSEIESGSYRANLNQDEE